MRRRLKTRGPVNVLTPAPVPAYVDDTSLPVRERLRRYDAWVAEFYEPWVVAKSEFEDANGVSVVDVAERHFYEGVAGVVFARGVPRLPDAPWDPESL